MRDIEQKSTIPLGWFFPFLSLSLLAGRGNVLDFFSLLSKGVYVHTYGELCLLTCIVVVLISNACFQCSMCVCVRVRLAVHHHPTGTGRSCICIYFSPTWYCYLDESALNSEKNSWVAETDRQTDRLAYLLSQPDPTYRAYLSIPYPAEWCCHSD